MYTMCCSVVTVVADVAAYMSTACTSDVIACCEPNTNSYWPFDNAPLSVCFSSSPFASATLCLCLEVSVRLIVYMSVSVPI